MGIKPPVKVILRRSPKPDKKYRVVFTEPSTTVDFGQRGASDFTKHKDPARMVRYLRRHAGEGMDSLSKLSGGALVGKAREIESSRREKWGKDGIRTAGFWSRWLLWSFPTKKEAIEYIHEKFGVVVATRL